MAIYLDLKKTKTDDDKFGTTPWFLFQMNEMTALDYNTVHWWPSLFYTYKSAVYSSASQGKTGYVNVRPMVMTLKSPPLSCLCSIHGVCV